MSWYAPIVKEMKLVEAEIRSAVASDQETLTDICMHVIGAGGKRIRPGIAILAYKAVGGDSGPNIIGIAAAFELIHSATLIHDDINDIGETRRGRVAAYKKYGVQKALIAGDFLFVRSFRLGGYWNKESVETISNACTATAESEMLQSHYDFDPSTPENVYIAVITGKTARPIEAAARVGAYLGGATKEQVEALGAYGVNLGIAFQIIDDILDLDGTEKELGKTSGTDLTDGKATLPLQIAMADPKLGPSIAGVFRKKDKTRAEVEEALALALKTNAVERSRAKAREYAERAIATLAPLPSSPYKNALIELAEVVVSRRA
ncbi:MAG TPA: polyprenyl synthetase family protein [Methanomassiliicoccales archaeon]|nr:polyprenyl synthetase family protein [Methanomassiliicoccales archaeon]